MNITKYASSGYYGYGIPVSSPIGDRSFRTEVGVSAKSEKTNETLSILNWHTKKFPPGPILLVFDSDSSTWKEYFSGITVKIASTAHTATYDVDSRYPDYYGALSVIDPHECTSTEFAEWISRYNDDRIKEMVNQILVVSEEAPQWEQAFLALVTKVRDERAQKEANRLSLEAKLAAGFGKYGKKPSEE